MPDKEKIKATLIVVGFLVFICIGAGTVSLLEEEIFSPKKIESAAPSFIDGEGQSQSFACNGGKFQFVPSNCSFTDSGLPVKCWNIVCALNEK